MTQPSRYRRQPLIESRDTAIWEVSDWARESWSDEEGNNCVALFLIYSPNPFGVVDWYAGALYFLTDHEGKRAQIGNDRYSFMGYRVDPGTPPNIQADKLRELDYMKPIQIHELFAADSDAAALQRVEAIMIEIASGRLMLEQCYSFAINASLQQLRYRSQ